MILRAASRHIPPSASMNLMPRSVIRMRNSLAGCSTSWNVRNGFERDDWANALVALQRDALLGDDRGRNAVIVERHLGARGDFC